MTPDERERADQLAATAFQLANDLVSAQMWGEAAQVKTIRAELDRVCTELAPYLRQYQDERNAWVNRRFHHDQ
jgi:hypothetical protein